MKTKTILWPDDMRVGQFVTMFQGKFYVEDESSGNMLLGYDGHRQGEEDKHYNGMVLEIIAIDFPYVAIVDMLGNTRHFDLRAGWLFKALSQEYVNCYKKFTKRNN